MARRHLFAVFILAGTGWAVALDPAPAGPPVPAGTEPAAPNAAVEKAASPRAGPEASVTEATFRAGQVWQYRSRPAEEGAILTVLLVERDPKIGQIVHFRLDGLHLRSPENPGGYADSIDHLPMSGAALARSVTTLVRDSEPLPDFQDDLRAWRRLVAAHRAGVYNMTVAEIVAAIEVKLNR